MPWAQSYRQNGTDVVKHTFTWVADGSGNATVVSGQPISGEIRRVVFVPGTPAPTAAYVVKLNDADTVNVLAAQGDAAAALSATVVSITCPGVVVKDLNAVTSVVPIVVDGILTLVISAAGANAQGKVIVYVR